MEKEEAKAIIEAILFAAGKEVSEQELSMALEKPKEEIEEIIKEMQNEEKPRGIEIIKMEDNYQMVSKKEYYEYIYPIIDKRAKPNLSNAALETLAIIAYNPRITRAEIESIRGVEASASLYKLREYELIEEAGKADLPGKPMTYKTTHKFLKMFGYTSLNDLPDLPRYKLDENKQIVIDEILENQDEKNEQNKEEQEEVEMQDKENIEKIERNDKKWNYHKQEWETQN